MKYQQIHISRYGVLKALYNALEIDFKNVMFTYEKPLPDFTINRNYLSRIILNLSGKSYFIASNGKKIKINSRSYGDIVYTGKNCWLESAKKYPDMPTEEKEVRVSLSVLLTPNYIRVVKSKKDNIEPVSVEYYHTNKVPSELLLSLSHSLNIVRNRHGRHVSALALPLLRTFLLEVINEIEQDEPRLASKAEQSFKTIKDYVDLNYHLPINLSQVCDELGFNPNYVSQMFKRFEKENFTSYLEKQRMGMAIEMLSNPYNSISYVAKQCGYASTAYFIKVFKQINGITPGKFKLQS